MVKVVREGQVFISRPLDIDDQEAPHATREWVTEDLLVSPDAFMCFDIAFSHAAELFARRGENQYRGALTTGGAPYDIPCDGYVICNIPWTRITILGQPKPSTWAQSSAIFVRMSPERKGIVVLLSDQNRFQAFRASEVVRHELCASLRALACSTSCPYSAHLSTTTATGLGRRRPTDGAVVTQVIGGNRQHGHTLQAEDHSMSPGQPPCPVRARWHARKW